jgi:excisionase family DNA binding protein
MSILEEHAERKRALPITLRRQEAADLIGVSVRQVDNLVKAGKLKKVRFGPRCVRIETSSLIEAASAAEK